MSLRVRLDARSRHPRRSRRRLALLGGTTTWGDCLVAARCLLAPRGLVRGPAIREYEEAFASQVGVRHAVSFAAGRVGLYGILRALGVGEGDEVLLQVPTHIVVANAIRYTGAEPVYVDCETENFNIDLRQAAERITPRTKILILQHTFGVPADLDGALALARRHNLEVVEDCVHALGATYAGRQVGSFGRAAFFSTEETKTISSTMGGMVTTDDPELAARIRAFQESCDLPSTILTARYVLKLALYHVLTQPYIHRYSRPMYELLGRRHPLPRPTSEEELRGERPTGYKQGFSNAQAVLALRQLRRLDRNVAHRAAIAEAYRSRLTESGFQVCRPPEHARPSFVRYPVWVVNRSDAERATRPYAVLGSWFTSVLEEAASPIHGGYAEGSCPRAEEASRHLVNLPTHPQVHMRDVESLVSALAGVYQGKWSFGYSTEEQR